MIFPRKPTDVRSLPFCPDYGSIDNAITPMGVMRDQSFFCSQHEPLFAIISK